MLLIQASGTRNFTDVDGSLPPATLTSSLIIANTHSDINILFIFGHIQIL